MKPKRRWPLVAVPVALTVALVGFSAVFGCCPFTELLFSYRFNSEKWKAGNALDRGRMSQDLMNNNRLTGLTRDEVLAQLGPPDYDLAPDSTLTYRIDIGYRFGPTPWLYVLYVRFDATGHAVHVFAKD